MLTLKTFSATLMLAAFLFSPYASAETIAISKGDYTEALKYLNKELSEEPKKIDQALLFMEESLNDEIKDTLANIPENIDMALYQNEKGERVVLSLMNLLQDKWKLTKPHCSLCKVLERRFLVTPTSKSFFLVSQFKNKLMNVNNPDWTISMDEVLSTIDNQNPETSPTACVNNIHSLDQVSLKINEYVRTVWLGMCNTDNGVKTYTYVWGIGWFYLEKNVPCSLDYVFYENTINSVYKDYLDKHCNSQAAPTKAVIN